MKRILCYGDSNTWGYDPVHSAPDCWKRYDEETRWPCVMERILGAEYRVLEAGLCGRTTVFSDPLLPFCCGAELLEPVLRMNDPVDLFVIMLGTNDTKDYFSASAETIADGMERLVKKLRLLLPDSLSAHAKIMIVSPVHLIPAADGTYYYNCCTAAAEKKTHKLALLYQQVAMRNRCFFFDAAVCASAGKRDGMHLEADGHYALGAALAAEIRKIFMEDNGI